ncbi:MAG TPA: class I SAM-dependent methyltransferase [bacterium]|nr:class I SAM-dependent methyltransferase [bacterium]
MAMTESSSTKEHERRLRAEVWDRSTEYYRIARDGTLATYQDNEAYRMALAALAGCSAMLDVGCGEGTTLALARPRVAVGCDLSRTALGMARRQYPQLALTCGDAAALPFRTGTLPAVGSFFAVEHFAEPERMLAELVRVVAPDGKLVVCGPNYGSPINRNPYWREHRHRYFVRRLWQCLRLLGHDGSTLAWEKNTPEFLRSGSVVTECDVLTNPYLGSLLTFLTARDMRIECYTAGWSWDRGREPLLQKLLRLLAALRLPPFTWCGPVFCVVARKRRA